jgi:tetratricopeptide (TPR) repeat protein
MVDYEFEIVNPHHQEAAEILKEIVKRRKGILGINHSDTLSSQHILAITYGHLGLDQEVAGILEEVVKWRRETLGINHSGTSSSRSDLAAAYKNLGRYQEAAEILEEIVK